MGCDGGSIPTRREQVKTKKKDERMDQESIARNKWLECSLSSQPLTEPIVSDKLGNLFNKSVLLEALLNNTLEGYDHIRSLKDMIELKLTRNPNYRDTVSSSGLSGEKFSAPFICPITGLETNGRYSFSVYVICGHVLSDKAIKEVAVDHCLVCQSKCEDSDLIPLNPSKEVMEQLKNNIVKKRRKRDKRKRERSKPEKVTTLSIKVKDVLKDASHNLEKFMDDDICQSLFTEKKPKTLKSDCK